MGKGKPALSAELSYLRRLYKAFVHQDFVSVQRNFALNTFILHNVFGIGVCGQAADASVRRQIRKGNIQTEIVTGKLVNRSTARQSCPVGAISEKELIEVLCDRRCDLFNIPV